MPSKGHVSQENPLVGIPFYVLYVEEEETSASLEDFFSLMTQLCTPASVVNVMQTLDWNWGTISQISSRGSWINSIFRLE